MSVFELPYWGRTQVATGGRQAFAQNRQGGTAVVVASDLPTIRLAHQNACPMQRLLQYLAYLILRVVVCVVQALPLTICQAGANALAWFFHAVLRFRRQVIDENLRHAYPELSDRQRESLALAMWRHLFLFGAEVAHTSRKIHATNWKRMIRVQGAATLVRLLLDDRALVLVSAHFGNFEICCYLLALFGYRMHAVARPLDNPFVDRWIAGFRSSTGMRILSKHDDYERIVDVLASRGVVAFLADQYAGDKGCWVPFFGREASAHKAIALFSLANDAPILVGGCRRIGRPMEYEMYLEAVADPRTGAPEVAGVRELTAWYTARLEQIVRRAPEQYWWLHRRWKDHRAARKKQRQAA
jgi:KDO2-lipid IV(A) lauroyltransferase